MANKNNNKGFSLVELLVVVVIMGIAVSIVTGSFISMYNARSKKATETLDAVIAQAKVDAMSGRDCRAVLEYSDGSDGNDEGYYAILLMRTDQDGDGVLDTSTEYKRESLGNDRLSFTVNGNDEYNIAEDSLYISFNGTTGAVRSAKYGTTNVLGGSVLTITVSSTATHVITLYKDTGEHLIDV